MGLEVIRTDFIALYCIVPNRNLQGLPKHVNGHPKVSKQNLLPQNMVWRTREVHDHHERTKTPHQTPHHREKGGREGASPPPDPTPQGGKEGIPSPPARPPHHSRRRTGDSHPQRPTPQAKKEGRGFPPTETPHHRERRRASQSTPPQPTPQKGVAFQTISGGVGGAAERVTRYGYRFSSVGIGQIAENCKGLCVGVCICACISVNML